MRILDIRETTVRLRSSLRNAFIDFSQMTTSVVAVVTDVSAAGGRSSRAAPHRHQRQPGPQRIWGVMMAGEKPGGHGDRSVAVGAIDMALWDAVAKVQERPPFRVLADRYSGGRADERAFVSAARGYYQPGKSLTALQDEMKSYLGMGYTVVKMKIGGDTLDGDL